MNGSHFTDEAMRLTTYRIMARSGYLRHVASAGSKLARWHHYLEQLGRRGPPPQSDPRVQPRIFPAMEGLVTPAWRDVSQLPAGAILERAASAIRGELAAVDVSRALNYPTEMLASGRWSVLPVFVFGEAASSVIFAQNLFPETARIVQELPDSCAGLPLADSVFSAHAPRTHLLPHFSWDPFRLRLHLGLSIPENCRLRVGDEMRQWHEGKVLAFHDACEHETWNDSDQIRTVLIVDIWHPDLTPIEREAILAGFRKKEIRGVLMRVRTPLALQMSFSKRFAKSEADDPLIPKYWDA